MDAATSRLSERAGPPDVEAISVAVRSGAAERRSDVGRLDSETIDECRAVLVADPPARRARVDLALDRRLGFEELLEVAERAAPAVLLLLGDGRRSPLRLGRPDPLTVSLSFAPDPWCGSDDRFAIAVAILAALIESDLPRSLLAHPPLCVPRPRRASIDILQRYANGEATVGRGRFTPLPAVTANGQPLSVQAQKSLTSLVLHAERTIGRLVARDRHEHLVATIVGEAPMPSDVRPTARRRAWQDTPVKPTETVALIDIAPELALDDTGGRQPLARMARALSRQSPFDIVVCPWHRVRLQARAVTVEGEAVCASAGRLSERTLPATPVGAMLYYPLGVDGDKPASETAEREAVERLRRRRVPVGDARRRRLVEFLLIAAEARGVVTNLAGRHGSWWRKDRLEFGLRAYSRATGRTINRPQTFVVAGAQVSGVLDAFARRGLPAIVKPALGTGGDGVQVVQPGGRALVFDDLNYVVQDLPQQLLLAGDRKVDVRFYLTLDTTTRRGSRRLPPVFVRAAPAPYQPGRLASEITNTAFRQRRGLPVGIRPLDGVTEWSPEIRAQIRTGLDALTDELLDAIFWAFGRGPRRALLWGLDALPVLTEDGVELSLLELNVYPTLYRDDSTCDGIVDAMLRYGYAPAVRAGSRGFRPLSRRRAHGHLKPALGTLLTLWPTHPTAVRLHEACRQRNVNLLVSDVVDPRCDFVFQWGYEVDRQPTDIQQFCLDAGIDLINPNVLGKGAQYRALSRAGLPIPEAKVCRSLSDGLAAAWELGFPVVCKPLFGTLSRGVLLLGDEEALVQAWTGPPRLIQRYVPQGNRAARILTVGTHVTHAVMRHAHDGFHATWDMGRTADLEPYDPPADVELLAVEASQTLGVDVGAVDLVPTPTGPMVLEVNHRRVEFHVAELHGRDAIEQIASYLAGRAEAKRAAGE